MSDEQNDVPDIMPEVQEPVDIPQVVLSEVTESQRARLAQAFERAQIAEVAFQTARAHYQDMVELLAPPGAAEYADGKFLGPPPVNPLTGDGPDLKLVQ